MHATESPTGGASKKDFLQQWFDELYIKNNEQYIRDHFAADGKAHGLAGVITGPDEFIPFWRGVLQTFPGCTVKVLQCIEQGDSAFFQCEFKLPHQGKEVVTDGFGIVSFKNNQITEAQQTWNFLHLFEEMGILPADSLMAGLSGQKFVRAS